MILDGNPPRAFAARRLTARGRSDRSVGRHARGHVSGDWLGLARDLDPDTEQRRQGWRHGDDRARWATGRPAGAPRYGYLQVDRAPTQARTHRVRSGSASLRHHGYLYLDAPTGLSLQTQRTRSVGA